MNNLSQYTIQFSGLKEGKYQFDFVVDEDFFGEFEGIDIEKGLVNVTVHLEKRSTHLVLKFDISGNVKLVCDRCLDEYSQPLECSRDMYVKFSDEPQPGADSDVMFLHHDDHKIELGQLIYEFIVLNLPVKHVHPKGGCNREMLKRLEKLKPKNKEDEVIDPRWNDLRKIFDN